MSNLSANISTNTTLGWPPYVHEPHLLRIIRLIFVSLLAILGLLGNLWVAIKVSKRRSPLSSYICNLAVADMGVLALSFPIAIIKEQMPTNWPLGSFFCQYLYPLTEVFHGASIWSIAAIAAERYHGMKIRTPSKNNGKRTHVWYILAVIWFSSFTFTSLPLFFFVKYQKVDQGKFCIVVWPKSMQVVYAVILSLLWYLLPLTVVLFTYIYISSLLRSSTTFHRQSLKHLKHTPLSFRLSATETRRMKENKRALKILTPMVLVFTITMLPLNTLRVVLSLRPELTMWKYFLVVYNLSVIAITVNSAADPLIYFIVTNNFLPNSFCQVFKWLKCFRDVDTRSQVLQRRKNCMETMQLQRFDTRD
ncbi:QRFP-like peptide receptor [Exaiptasia diaphana]|uniref:G-protein coupled receptors family 1 profile domain-containing protein n=1 Tax=Exaiptasia diaphana TaxID=2652724 RepID=A0A913XG87_EXADI|nr:QRFP-like peptide receptor [Exaiptasia diaphana]